MWILWSQIRPCGWKLSHIPYADSIFPCGGFSGEKRGFHYKQKPFKTCWLQRLRRDSLHRGLHPWCWVMTHQKLKLLLPLLHWCCSSTDIPPNKIQHLQIFACFCFGAKSLVSFSVTPSISAASQVGARACSSTCFIICISGLRNYWQSFLSLLTALWSPSGFFQCWQTFPSLLTAL